MSAQLDELTAQVHANTTVVQSATIAFEGLAAKFAAAKQDPEAIQKLADELKASTAKLSAALVGNTDSEESGGPPPAA